MTDKTIRLPEFPELVFDEEPHIYLLDGVQIPSVSNIMEPLNRAKYDGISERTLDRAAEKGTIVHNAIENFLKFDIVDIPSEHQP